MKNWIYLLIAIIFFVIIYVFGEKRRERAKELLDELLEERKKVWRETREKEHLREVLTKKLNVRARVVSTVIILSFIAASIASGLWAMGQIDITTAFFGGLIVEAMILVVSQLYIHKPYEIRYYLGEVEPFLRGKIFANHQKLDGEIEHGNKRIEIIDIQIQRLQRLIAA